MQDDKFLLYPLQGDKVPQSKGESIKSLSFIANDCLCTNRPEGCTLQYVTPYKCEMQNALSLCRAAVLDNSAKQQDSDHQRCGADPSINAVIEWCTLLHSKHHDAHNRTGVCISDCRAQGTVTLRITAPSLYVLVPYTVPCSAMTHMTNTTSSLPRLPLKALGENQSSTAPALLASLARTALFMQTN